MFDGLAVDLPHEAGFRARLACPKNSIRLLPNSGSNTRGSTGTRMHARSGMARDRRQVGDGGVERTVVLLRIHQRDVGEDAQHGIDQQREGTVFGDIVRRVRLRHHRAISLKTSRSKSQK